MQSSEIDTFFHLASQGEKEAYWMLYQKFVERANSIAYATMSGCSNFKGITEDFCLLIDELFFKAINEYGPEKGLFSKYVDYLLSRRLVSSIKKHISDLQTYTMDIDFDGDSKAIEQVADPNQKSMPADIAMESFKYKIATPNNRKPKAQRIKDKVLLLQYAGYQNTEICKMLKISYSTLRRLNAAIRDEEEIANIKLDLK